MRCTFMSDKLWLVKNDWANRGECETYDRSSNVIGVFDDFDLAVEAVRNIYAENVGSSVLNNATNYCHVHRLCDGTYISRPDVYISGYRESLERFENRGVIYWSLDEDRDNEETYDNEYYIIPIKLNEAGFV